MGDRMGNAISRPSTDTRKILVFSCDCSECHEVTLPLHFFMNVFSRSPTPVVVSVAFNKHFDSTRDEGDDTVFGSTNVGALRRWLKIMRSVGYLVLCRLQLYAYPN
ncbi:uncharacterized protein LACBIDRAFT_311472 [Laccaria bicolor S238N-H82]|uniref:Predicted protein n=1 Tax=Laccaria bicolor (strain S238N-H82 / ATCC MYA-4686) TaxID=486041 RepID=B0CXG4_LACBS|nr:uncharacterized protein LACBIDRAFT_311472 [Laccaria bicolor S238N-H82]EDR12257.1 predicted protein [Laccaria bicolor S238N-H82]|eukprot:XP_001876521.1 predicted protein [Laccaria bicolor S238N-H82]